MNVINKYNKSMIYTIRSPHTERYYIGSTIQKLCKRFSDHNINYKDYLDEKHHFVTSFKILELGDAYIELLEEYECENKTQLLKREGEFIREHKNNCVNKCIAGRTKKQYNIDTKEHIQERSKQYNINNKERMQEWKKQYNIDTKEQRKEYDKQRYIDRKNTRKSLVKQLS